MPDPVVIATWKFGATAVKTALPLLEAGQPALDAALAGAQAVEDDPAVDSVGYGGIANAIGQAFRYGDVLPDRTWVGQITVGVVILGVMGIGTRLFMKKFTAASRERTVKKYESRQQQQRVQYGHDVHERAEAAK